MGIDSNFEPDGFDGEFDEPVEYNEHDNLEEVPEMFEITEKLEDVSVKELDEALHFLCTKTVTELTKPENDVYYNVVFRHLMFKYQKKGRTYFSLKELTDDTNNLILDATLESLYKKGLVDALIDENGEVSYKITEDGKRIANEFKK